MTARESFDQLGGRFRCVVSVQTFRDAAATFPRFVAHQAVERVDHLRDFPSPRLERLASSEAPHACRVIGLVEGHRQDQLRGPGRER
jgi:hypothetical protein